MFDALGVEILQPRKYLGSVHPRNILIFDPAQLDKLAQATTRTVLFEDIHSVSMYLPVSPAI